MAKIKGLELEAKLDSSKLKKELKNVNSDLRESVKQGRALDKALQVDPDNIELTSKKTSQLKKQLELTEDKTKLLKKQLEDLGDDVDPREVVKLETAIINAETQAKKLKNQLSKVTDDIDENEVDFGLENSKNEIDDVSSSVGDLSQGFDNAGGAANLVGGKISSIASSMGPWGAAVGTAIGIGVSALSNYLEYLQEIDEATGKLIAQEGFDPLSNFAGEIDFSLNANVVGGDFAKSNKFIIDDVIEQFSDLYEIPKEEARKYGVVATKVFKNQIKDASDLNSAMEILAQSTANIGVNEGFSLLRTNQQNWNLTNEDSLVLLDNIDNRVGILGRNAEDLPDTFREWGDTFASSNVSAQEFLKFLDIGLLSGVENSDKLADSFNEFLIKMGDGTDDTKAAFDKLGLSYDEYSKKIANGDVLDSYFQLANAISNVADPQERLNIAGQIYGTQGEEVVATTLAQADAQAIYNLELAKTNLANAEFELAQRRKFGNLTLEQEQLLLNTIEQEKNNLAVAEGAFVANDLNNQVNSLVDSFAISAEQGEIFKQAIERLSDPAVSYAEKQSIINEELGGFINATQLANGTGDGLKTTLSEIAKKSSEVSTGFDGTSNAAIGLRTFIGDLDTSVLNLASGNGTLSDAGQSTVDTMANLEEGSSKTGSEIENLTNEVRELNTEVGEELAGDLDYAKERSNLFKNSIEETGKSVDETSTKVNNLKTSLDNLPLNKTVNVNVNEVTNRSVNQATSESNRTIQNTNRNASFKNSQGVQGKIVPGNNSSTRNIKIQLNAETTNPEELAKKIAGPLIRELGKRS